MDSFFARNRLSAYLDGALSDAEAAELSEAIERDPKLQAEYLAMQQTVELLRREGPAQAPAGFHARVMEQVSHEPGTGGVVVQLRRWWNRVPVEAVALAAAAAVVVLVIQGKPGDTPDDAMAVAKEPTELLPRRGDRPTGSDRQPAAAAEPAAEPEDLGSEGDAVADNALAEEAASTRPEGPAPTAKKAEQKQTSGEQVEPYVADWEQAPAQGEMATPIGYRLTVSSPEVLYNLSSIAELAGGTVRDLTGRTLEPSMLSKTDDYAQPMIVVPRDQTEVVRGHLEALGGQSIATSGAPSLYPADYGVFVVEVRFRP